MDAATETRRWIQDFVIAHGLCPFAARPFWNGQVEITTSEESDPEALFYGALHAGANLVEVPAETTETTLFVMPSGLGDFPTFLDFIATLEDALAESGADQLLQLAHFHPDYAFAGVDADDPGNRTNRSPYPTVQFLRVDRVAEAVAGYPEVEAIPERNIARMRGVNDRMAAADRTLK